MLPRNQELIDEFLKLKVEEYSLSPKTYRDYTSNLTYFCRFIEEKFDATLDTLNKQMILDYRESLMHLRNGSINTYMSPITSFCAWGTHPTVGLFEVSPMPHIKKNKVELLTSHKLTATEIFNIRAAQVIKKLQHAAIFELFISSGMRRGELAHLRANDIDFTVRPLDGELKVPSPYCGGLIRSGGYGSGETIKRTKPRKIYIGKLVAKLLYTHMQAEGIPLDSNFPVFPMPPDTIRSIIHKIALKSNLIVSKYKEVDLRKRGFMDLDVNKMVGASEKYKEMVRNAQEKERKNNTDKVYERTARVQPARKVTLHPHAVRHFYAFLMYYRNWYGNRSDIVDLRDLLGHTSTETTNIYLTHEHKCVENDKDWARVLTGNGLEYRSLISAAQVIINGKKKIN